ncbi:zinc-binding dehydrogenase [Methylobacterium persicinum]
MALPDGLGDVEAASLLLKGLTACMLLQRVHVVKAGDVILVHAAAGGVGQLPCRWGRHLGATVIGTAGSADKAERARAAGAHEVILYRDGGFAETVMALTGGRGADAVYDAVGRETFDQSLKSLAYFGTLVNYGQASGPVEPMPPAALGGRSNSLSRPVVFHFVRDRASLNAMATEVFAAFAAGVLRVETTLQMPLAEAGRAHAALEARATVGATVLLP